MPTTSSTWKTSVYQSVRVEEGFMNNSTIFTLPVPTKQHKAGSTEATSFTFENPKTPRYGSMSANGLPSLSLCFGRLLRWFLSRSYLDFRPLRITRPIRLPVVAQICQRRAGIGGICLCGSFDARMRLVCAPITHGAWYTSARHTNAAMRVCCWVDEVWSSAGRRLTTICSRCSRRSSSDSFPQYWLGFLGDS